MQHLNPKLAWTILIVAVVIVFGAVGIYYWNFSKEEPKTTTSVSTSKPTSSPTATSTTTTSPTSTATTDETASWQSYSSKDYNYSVKFPQDWVSDFSKTDRVTLNSSQNEQIKKEIEAGKVYGEGYMKDITITYYEKVSDVSSKAQSFDSLMETLKNEHNIASYSKITFAGQNAYSAILGGLGAYYGIYVEKGSHVYLIMFGNRESKDKLTATDNLILSTFKFTQ